METHQRRPLLLASLTAVLTAGVSTGAIAQINYSEPSRGFMMERAYTVEERRAAVDLQSGGAQDSAAGIRLGLPAAELILNHGRLNPRGSNNEALLKVGLDAFVLEGLTIDWAVYGGISHFDPDGEDSVTNLGVGTALTTNINNAILNFAPEIIFDDGAQDDGSDVYINLGFGAHYNLPETRVGRFQPGLEFTVTTRDEADGSSADTSLMLGSRWLYNENVTLDLVVLNFGAQDQVSIPGFVRLNVAF